MDESQMAGAGYVLSFFNDIEQLSSYYANYINTVLSMQNKYPNERSLENMGEEDRQTLIQAAQGLRTWIVRTYIKAQALKGKINAFDNERLRENYQKAIKEFISQPSEIVDYVIEINKAFCDGVLIDLLNEARDFYARLTE